GLEASEHERRARVAAEIRARLAAILEVSAEELEDGQRLVDYGVEHASLERLRRELEGALGIKIEAYDWSEFDSIASIAVCLARSRSPGSALSRARPSSLEPKAA